MNSSNETTSSNEQSSWFNDSSITINWPRQFGNAVAGTIDGLHVHHQPFETGKGRMGRLLYENVVRRDDPRDDDVDGDAERHAQLRTIGDRDKKSNRITICMYDKC